MKEKWRRGRDTWFGEDFRKWCGIMKSMDEGRREGITCKKKIKDRGVLVHVHVHVHVVC